MIKSKYFWFGLPLFVIIVYLFFNFFTFYEFKGVNPLEQNKIVIAILLVLFLLLIRKLKSKLR